MSFRRDAAHSIIQKTGIPEGWKDYTIGEVSKMFSGGTPNRSEGSFWRDGTIPWITPTDLTSNANRYISNGEEHITDAGLRGSNATLLEPGTIIFSSRGTVGNLAIAKIPLTINQSCEALRPRWEEWSPLFMYYLLGFGMSAFHRLAGGTTFGAITRREIARVRFAFPPPAEQDAIARVLDAADTAIEHIKAALKHSEQLERGVLVDLLSRGVGESGLLRDENDHITTSIGKLPASWEIRRVGNEFDIQNGFTINEDRKPVHRKRRYLRVANVHRDVLKLADVSELEAKDQEFTLRELQVDDLLVVEGHADRMQIGRCARVTPEVAGMTFQNHLFRLRSRGRVDPYFGAIWLNSTYAQRYWNGQCATSSGLNTINQRMLKSMVIPVPPSHEQERIVQIVQGVRAAKESLKSKLAAQEALKAALLRDLLTGRVRVGAATPATVES